LAKEKIVRVNQSHRSHEERKKKGAPRLATEPFRTYLVRRGCDNARPERKESKATKNVEKGIEPAGARERGADGNEGLKKRMPLT